MSGSHFRISLDNEVVIKQLLISGIIKIVYKLKKIGLVIISVWLAVCNAVAADRGSRLVSKAKDTEIDCLQYLPMVFPEAMKLCGQPTRSGWGRLAVSQGFSVILMAGTVYSLKHMAGKRRPDRSDCRSFPSGHSAWAFAGATVIARGVRLAFGMVSCRGLCLCGWDSHRTYSSKTPLGVGCGRRSTYRGGYDRAGLFSRRPHLWRARTE